MGRLAAAVTGCVLVNFVFYPSSRHHHHQAGAWAGGSVRLQLVQGMFQYNNYTLHTHQRSCIWREVAHSSNQLHATRKMHKTLVSWALFKLADFFSKGSPLVWSPVTDCGHISCPDCNADKIYLRLIQLPVPVQEWIM